jgi:hypothetical protein
VTKSERRGGLQEQSSAHYVHPEFGYFCLGPGLRRVLRVAVVFILFGLIIGTSVIRLRAGHDRRADNAWTIAHIEPSRAATVLPAATEPGSSLTGNAAKGEPNGAIKPFPTRIVRVRPAKDRSPLAAVSLGRTGPAEPVPAASVSADAIAVEHEEDAAPRAALAYAAPSAATFQPSAKAKKHQRIARTQTRRRKDEDDNRDQRASYWTGRGSIDAQNRRGGYRAWAYGGPRSWGWF